MNIIYTGAFLIIEIFLLTTVQSCFNNQRTGFCPRSRKVHQTMCPGVKPWPCNWAELRCGCVDGTSRRKDGKCVKPDECSGTKNPAKGDGKTKKNGTEKAAGKENSAEAEEEPDSPNTIMYFSGGTNGCPGDVNQCITACAKLGFPEGMCDPFLFRNCYCTGPRSKQEGMDSQLQQETEKRRLFFPYGRVLGTGDLILQLRESYDCPKNQTKCFSECNNLGLEGAFCSLLEPHYCTCEAHTSTYAWDYYQDQKYPLNETAITNCTDQGYCSSYCASLGTYYGFCSDDNPALCYCYEMYPYGAQSANALPERPGIYSSGNHFTAVKTLLQSREPIALVLISSVAWRRSKCVCMETMFEEALHDYAVREVSCHVPEKTSNGWTSVEKQKANVTFTVKHANGATTIELKSGESRLPFGFLRSYAVLAATPTCAVVLVTNVWRDKPLCALWGLVNARNNDEDACFTAMEKLCMQPVSDAFIQRDRCGESYREEMRRYSQVH